LKKAIQGLGGDATDAEKGLNRDNCKIEGT